MTTRLSRALLVPIVALTAVCGAGTGIGNPAEFLYDYDLITVDLQATADSVRKTGRLRLVLGGDTVDLQLEPYSVRSVDYRLYEVLEDGSVSVERTPPDTYRVLFKGGGEARLLVSDTALFGYVHRNGEWFFVEPLSRFDGVAGPGELISYRQSDIVPDARESIGMAPRMDRLDGHAAAEPDGAVIEGTQPRLLELAAEADGEFTQSNGGAAKPAANVIEGIINEVDGIYDANLSVQVRLTATFVSVNPATDPWNSTQFGHGPKRLGPFNNSQENIDCSVNNGTGLWEQFRNYWNSNPARTGVRRDAAALFTTRDLRRCATAQDPEDELFGTAGETGSVCRLPNRAYTIQEQYAQVNSAGLAAHELGHSIGASHDPSGQCPGDPDDWIMCGTVRAQSTLFSTQSRTAINSHFNNHGVCVVPPIIDLSVASGDTYHFSAPTPPNVGRTEAITIRNLSTGTPLTISNRTNLVSGACFQQVSTPPVTIPPNGSADVNVRLLCASQGFKTGTLTVDTDDPVTPSYQVTLRGQVKSGTVFNIGFRAGYKPSFSAPRTTFTTFEAHPDGQLGFYFDPNQGRFENRPGGLCPPPASGENPGYFKIRLVGAAISGCRFQASWDSNETVCSQGVVNALNSGTEIILNTDDVHNAPGSCQLAQPLDNHVNFGEDHHIRVTFLRTGGEYRRQINFRQNSQVHFSSVGHDTWVNQASPNTNYGQDTILRVSNQSGAVKYSFLYAGVPINANIRSSHLLLAVGPATIGSAAVFELHDPFLFGFCNENTLTWNSWPGCFNGFTHVQTINNIPGGSLLRFDVSGAVSPSGGLHAFGINTPDTAANRWFGSGESAADKPYLVTTTSN